jgi:hypothetical protein
MIRSRVAGHASHACTFPATCTNVQTLTHCMLADRDRSMQLSAGLPSRMTTEAASVEAAASDMKRGRPAVPEDDEPAAGRQKVCI